MQALRYFTSKWRRPKHKGVSGNLSTVVIITSIIIGSYFMAGGGYPEFPESYPADVLRGEPYAVQPKHGKEYGMTVRELKMRPLGRNPLPPVPTFGPTLPPEVDEFPEPPPQLCADQSITFLVDVSGSMLNTFGGAETKIDRVKAGLNRFVDGLGDDAVVGLYTFSEPFDGIKVNREDELAWPLPEPPASEREPRQRLPMSYYGDVGSNMNTIINDLNPYKFAATYMRDGIQSTITWLNQAKSEYKAHKQNLIVISDGVPETDVPGDQDIPFGNGRNYSPIQDPIRNPNLGAVLKQNGVNVYSIAIYEGEQDIQMLTRLRPIMQGIASSTANPHYMESVGAGNIDSILNTIREDICPSGG